MQLLNGRLLGLLVGVMLTAYSVPVIAAAPREARQPETVPGRYIVLLERGGAGVTPAVEALERARGFRADRVFARLNAFSAPLTAQLARMLAADPGVAAVVPDYRLRASDAPLAGGEAAPTGTRRIEATSATVAQSTSDRRVAVLDTGVDLDHPDLNVVDGVNCITPGSTANDDNGHGTHVAGTIAARNNGSGVVGVAPGTPLVAVKVLDAAGDGSTSSIVCGIEWVLSTLNDSNPGNDIAVVNMSLGGGGDPVQSCSTTTDPMHRAVCAAHAAGVTFVVAAGNDGWDFDYAPEPDVPAAYPQVLTVAAITDSDGRPGALGGAPACMPTAADDRYAPYSNYAMTTAGAGHTVSAPGTCIRSTWPGGGYKTISGTSMAAPHVAALVALCLSEGGTAGPCAGLTPTQIVDRVRADAHANRLAAPGYGFASDSTRPSRYYGDLVRVGLDTPPATPATRTITPIATVVNSGALAAGGYARLAANDDSNYAVSSTTRTTFTVAWYARFASVPREVSTLSVVYRGRNTRTCSQSVALWNWLTGTWVALDSRSVGTAEIKVAKAAGGTLSDYVSGPGSDGELRVRVRCTSTAGTFTVRADQLTVTYTGS